MASAAYIGVPTKRDALTFLEYIESTGTQYIDAGIIGKTGIKVAGEFALTESQSSILLGCYNPQRCYLLSFNSMVPRYGYVDWYNGNGSLTTNTKYEFEVDFSANSQYLKLNGTTVASSANTTTFTNSTNIFVFAYNDNGIAGDFAKCRLYSLKLYENGTLVRDFIPCKNTSGTVGLYDLANGVFYENAGTGTFTAGQVVEEVGGETVEVARNLKSIYIGINGIARKVAKGYIGVNGVARLFYSGLDALFGTGADGDLYIASGQTVTLSVPSKYVSVVEMNYKSITIESGGVLKCDNNNNGLVLRCQGQCIINGTIDQSAKSGLPNSSPTFDYPDEISCGAGGNGSYGHYSKKTIGGTGMAGHKGGGGWSGGGAGGSRSSNYPGGNGGSVDSLTIANASSSLFVGGTTVTAGQSVAGTNGGGGGGAKTGNYYTGAGASGAGASAADGVGLCGGGGAGNYGGGVVMLYVGGNTTINGTINCAGGKGGDGGDADMSFTSSEGGGAGAGGAGGGSIYVMHNGTYSNNGTMNVNGGAAGANGTAAANKSMGAAVAGGIGTVTVKQFEKGMIK